MTISNCTIGHIGVKQVINSRSDSKRWQKLDKYMSLFASQLQNTIKIPESECTQLATAIASEIVALSEDEQRELNGLSPIPNSARREELVAFEAFMDFVRKHDNKPYLVRAQVIVQNYLCFVYLGEAIFKGLRRICPTGSVTKKCAAFLTDNPVRAFRNAVAHANWHYKTDFSGLTFFAKKGDGKDEPMETWEVTQSDLEFWQALARCVAYIAFSEKSNMRTL